MRLALCGCWLFYTTLLLFLSAPSMATFVAHGTAEGDTILAGESSPLLSLGVSVPYFGVAYDSVKVFEDGFLTFDDTERTVYELAEAQTVQFPVICALAVLVRTQRNNGAGQVFYRVTDDAALLNEASTIARTYSGLSRNFSATAALVITWDGVGSFFYNTEDDLTDTFQLVLATDGAEAVVLMQFDILEWIFDGNEVLYDFVEVDEIPFRAQISLYRGDGTSVSISESFSHAMLNVVNISNTDLPGRFSFRTFDIPDDLSTTTTGAPSTAAPTTTSTNRNETSTMGPTVTAETTGETTTGPATTATTSGTITSGPESTSTTIVAQPAGTPVLTKTTQMTTTLQTTTTASTDGGSTERTIIIVVTVSCSVLLILALLAMAVWWTFKGSLITAGMSSAVSPKGIDRKWASSVPDGQTIPRAVPYKNHCIQVEEYKQN